MFDKIIAYSIKHKLVVGLFVVALIGLGFNSMRTLPIDALPDITNNQVQIITTSPSLATQEVELFITYPIELALKSIPGIVELRSISRFGLSLITVVFEEDLDIYWARNQITERLREAEKNIPAHFGSPEMAPISTGLGEIYQYTVSADEAHRDQYSAMELRTIQDWIIIPQLLGTRGVAEVNTLGGILKEYEVAVNPDKLKSMGITMAEIFSALELNNENTGGAYIDKKPYAYFIRSIGMVSSLEDVSNIVVKVNNNIPVLIRDVAEVKFGNSIRYGATTRNGNGEVVNGMVMMLKGENSAEIVNLVKDKMAKIESTLPEGIQINSYLDRSKLINRAIATVRTNLIEGALIVIFILVLLIGNWRAGLIVASVIPLSLLFALSMMRLFGVSGNLMSLGAIDFGLIVDGAVIIVEAIVHRLQGKTDGTVLSREQMDEEVYTAASKIRTSAAFGEIIILIVYLPILALVGIEGKMFAPMAQTVSFAILGAFILSLTYVPMMSALFLNKKLDNKKNLSDKIIQGIHSMYMPVLNLSFKFKSLVLLTTLSVFAFSWWLFTQLGGEFIPTLSEGDIATHIIIPPGSSLEQEIATTTKAEKLLMKNFPEIEQVVSKIGSAEVPTDPMPMEVADAMVILKDKSEWTSASSKEEMFEKMEAVLDDLPGVTTEFSQPIQMRFNELMTGVRSDVGIKIFGEDIDLLVGLAEQAEVLIHDIEGIQDVRAETVSGLPQINVKFDKEKIALYGLNIQELNQAVNMGFAGASAGSVYEGEKKYSIVVRLAEPFRQDISNIQNLFISLPSGSQIPLSQVADIQLERGPAQISREDGRRRIIVGFNARDRDVESIVDEINTILEAELQLPVGYYIEYSGQFENLKRAKSRLSIAVPLALALIFTLLFFTFYSVKQSLLIFTAIPLSAVGGVFALWLRDMPFSISAGVGFIALFGVAVLNGIVLIGYFNQLKEEGITDIMERIKKGTSVRLRPVIMTAAVASLGFLPMALSTSAGAEVQKPLATVVIGGLITATLLTLIVLPILYYLVESFSQKSGSAKTIILLGILSTISFQMGAQISHPDQATEIALSNGFLAELNELKMAGLEEKIEGAYVMPKLNFDASVGQINTRSIDMNFSLSQEFNPFSKRAKKALAQSEYEAGKIRTELDNKGIELEIRTIWDELKYNLACQELINAQVENWQQVLTATQRKYELGESNSFESPLIQMKLESLKEQSRMCLTNVENIKNKLQYLLNTDEEIEPANNAYRLISSMESIGDDALLDHPGSMLAKQEIEVSRRSIDVKQAEKRPDFTLGYFIQSLKGPQEIDGIITYYDGLPRFQGLNLGIKYPLIGKGYSANIKVMETERMIKERQYNQLQRSMQTDLHALMAQYSSLSKMMEYYETKGLTDGIEIERKAKFSYTSGDISLLEYTQAIMANYELQQGYYDTLHKMNLITLKLNYLKNN